MGLKLAFSATRIFVCLVLLVAQLDAHGQVATAVFERVKDSVFVVKALDSKGVQRALGSAVLLPGGKFATNYHVVSDGTLYQVGRGARFVPATLFAADPDKDIGILDAPGIFGKPALLGKAANLKVGQPVYAVGAPEGLELSISEGIVSQLRGTAPPIIQTTAAISPGSSGGGLFDGEGRLVGLTSLYIEGGQNLNFALPVEWIAGIKPGVKQELSTSGHADWWARWVEFEKRSDWTGMRDYFLSWTRSEPQTANAWFGLGIANFHLQQYNDEVDALRRALKIDPEYALAWLNLAGAYCNLKRYSEEIDAYRHALRVNPDDADAWNGVGLTYLHIERYTDAIAAFREAIRINPEDAGAWWGLGVAHDGLQQYGEAIVAYRQSLSLKPQDATIWCLLGQGYNRVGRYSDAVGALRQSLRIAPELAVAWRSLGVAYGGLRRYNDAIDAYRQAVRIDPKYALAWYGLGLAYWVVGDQSAALDVVKVLRPLDPAKANDLFNLVVPR